MNAQQKAKQQKSVEQETSVVLSSQNLKDIPAEKSEGNTQVDGNADEDENELEEDDMKKKKKDKKKKKQLPEKEDKDKKRPGKKQVKRHWIFSTFMLFVLKLLNFQAS